MRRFLLAFGLIWVFVWCGVGFYLGPQHIPHIQRMGELAQQGNLVEFWSTWNAWKTHATSHAHALCFSFLIIVLALVMPEMRFSEKTKKILGVLLIVGVLLSTIFHWFFFLPLMVPGEILVAAMVLMSFIGVIKKAKEV